MNEPFLGTIIMFAGNFNPRGWALCNGQLMSIAQNAALFSILGTTYGGDGVTTFALPDMRSRLPVHAGTGPGLSTYVLGERTGAESVTLLSNQMPQHNHLVSCDSTANLGTNPTNNYPATTKTSGIAGTPIVGVYGGVANATMNPAMLANAGGSQPFSIIQPVLCVNFIIALQGIFPSRN